MRRRHRVPTGVGFGATSASERRRADLFMLDLFGDGRRAGAPPAPRGEDAEAESPGPQDVGADDLGETFTPENLAPDMAGLEFVLASSATVKMSGVDVSQPVGTVVTVVKWDNGKEEIDGKIAGTSVTVGKEVLAPKASMYKASVKTPTRLYENAIPVYAANVKALRDAIVKGKAAGKDQTANYKQLNKHLIIETQLNRLDHQLGAWTAYYDLNIGEKATPKAWPPLAPGWVKSMMVQ